MGPSSLEKQLLAWPQVRIPSKGRRSSDSHLIPQVLSRNHTAMLFPRGKRQE